MKPHVICHMVSSVDGRIVADRWPGMDSLTKAYEQTAALLSDLSDLDPAEDRSDLS